MPYTYKSKKDGIEIKNIPDNLDPNGPEVGAMLAKARSERDAASQTPQTTPSHLPTNIPMTPSHSPALPAEQVQGPVAEPETTAGGVMGGITRGLAPYAAGASIAAASGGTALVGAGAAGLTKLIGDPLITNINENFATNFTTPTEAVNHLLTWLGVENPDTEAERIVQTASDVAGSTVGGIGLGRALLGNQTLLQQANPTRLQYLGRILSDQPMAQIAGGFGGGAASQYVAERGGGPGAQLVAGLLGGAATGAPFIRRTPVQSTIGAAERASMAMPERPSTIPEPVQPMTEPKMVSTTKAAAERGLGSKVATQLLAEQAAPNPKTIEAAKRLGIEEYLQPDHVTTNQIYREFTQAIKSVPGSSTRAAEMTGLKQVGQRADRLISELGGTTDLSRLSEHVKTRISGTNDQLTQMADDAYTNLREKIPAQTRGPASNVLDFLKKEAQDVDGIQNLSEMEQSILRKLSPKSEGSANLPTWKEFIGQRMSGYMKSEGGHAGAMKRIAKEWDAAKKAPAEGHKIQPTYSLIDRVRRDIGAAAKQSEPFANADTGRAKYLYKLIDQDQAAIASNAGLGTAYNDAKELVKLRKGFEDDLVAIYGKKLDQSLVGKLETASKGLSKGDADKFINLMKSIPPEMRQDVTASALNTAFGRATQNGELNFNSFARWYEGLLANKQAHAAFMTNLQPSARKNISDLYRVSRGIADATLERIGTGRLTVFKDAFNDADSILGTIYSTAKRAAIGIPAEAITSSVGLPGAGIASGITSAFMKNKTSAIKAADDLISSPDFLMMAKNPTPKMAQNLAGSGVFKRYAKAAGLPTSDTDRTRWILNAMRAEQATKEKPDDRD